MQLPANDLLLVELSYATLINKFILFWDLVDIHLGNIMIEDLKSSTAKVALARKDLLKIMDSAQIDEILAANDSIDEAEKATEIETVNAGRYPAWPPNTDAGLAKWNVTRAQINAWLHGRKD